MLHSHQRWSPRHDSQQVDLVFVVDCTGSMGSYIDETKENVNFIARTISRTAFNVRFALIQYRDHPPEEESFVSIPHGFTSNVDVMRGLFTFIFF